MTPSCVDNSIKGLGTEKKGAACLLVTPSFPNTTRDQLPQ